MSESFVLLFVVLVGLGGPFLLYVLVRSEHDKRESMERDTAEQVARRDRRDGK